MRYGWVFVVVLVFCLCLVSAGEAWQPPMMSVTVPTCSSVSVAPVALSETEVVMPEEVCLPEPQVLVKPEPVAVARPASPVVERPYRIVRAKVTAYCPCARCCGRNSPGITSTNTSAWRRGLAVDPRAISYGTKIEIAGYGIASADDTGGAMRRSYRRGIVQIDVRMKNHSAAQEWGVRWMNVKVFSK